MNMDREIVDLYLDDIIPNRFQPREIFDDKALKELSASIKEHGVIQPIIVRKIGDKYEIIAGERRYKASAMAGLTKIPAIIRNLDDKESSKVALLENLQRRDLTAIEEARTYQKILDLDSMTQEELGKTMGKSQAAIANKIRLLALPDEVQEALLTGQISERHARSLLNLKDKKHQIDMLNKIIATRMTVRELDAEIKALNGGEDSSMLRPEPQKVEKEEIPDLNPVVKPYEATNNMDIDTIKAQAVDIIDTPKEAVDIDKLIKGPVNQEQAKPQEERNYRFIPSLEVEENTQVEEKKENPPQEERVEIVEPIHIDEIENLDEEPKIVNSAPTPYQPFANTESLLNEYRQNNNQPVINEPAIIQENVIETKVESLNGAIGEIRDLSRKLESQGFKIDLEEMDLDNKYQINISIVKKQDE